MFDRTLDIQIDGRSLGNPPKSAYSHYSSNLFRDGSTLTSGTWLYSLTRNVSLCLFNL